MSDDSKNYAPAATATPAKAARKSSGRKPKAAPVTRQQATAGFAGSVALGQLITMALAKWLGVM